MDGTFGAIAQKAIGWNGTELREQIRWKGRATRRWEEGMEEKGRESRSDLGGGGEKHKFLLDKLGQMEQSLLQGIIGGVQMQ